MYNATKFICHNSRARKREKDDLPLLGVRPSISPAVLHARADRMVDHDNGLLFPSIARIRVGEESRREQHRGDMFDKMFLYFLSYSPDRSPERSQSSIPILGSMTVRRPAARSTIGGFDTAVINDDNSIVLSRKSISRKASIESYFKTRRMRPRSRTSRSKESVGIILSKSFK